MSDSDDARSQRLAAFIDGDLEAEEAAQLAEDLRAHPEAAQEMAELLAMDQWLRSECQPEDAFVAALATHLDADAEGDAFVRTIERQTIAKRPRMITPTWIDQNRAPPPREAAPQN